MAKLLLIEIKNIIVADYNIYRTNLYYIYIEERTSILKGKIGCLCKEDLPLVAEALFQHEQLAIIAEIAFTWYVIPSLSDSDRMEVRYTYG